jgi:hypothetical protein
MLPDYEITGCGSLVQYKMSLKERAIPIQDEPEGGEVGHAEEC